MRPIISASLVDYTAMGLLLPLAAALSDVSVSVWCQCFSVVLTWLLSTIHYPCLLSLCKNTFSLVCYLFGLLLLIVLCWFYPLCTSLGSWVSSDFWIKLAFLILGDLTGWCPCLYLHPRPLPRATDLISFCLLDTSLNSFTNPSHTAPLKQNVFSSQHACLLKKRGGKKILTLFFCSVVLSILTPYIQPWECY